jgi:hypothetical protein
VFILVALIEKAFETDAPEAEALPAAMPGETKSISEDEAAAIVLSRLNNHPPFGYPRYISDHLADMGDVYIFTQSGGEFSEYMRVNMEMSELSYIFYGFYILLKNSSSIS